MEVIGAIASIAGILSLAGQALNGIIVLQGFFQSCASESHSIQRFLKRLNDLIQILEHARDLMTKLRTAPSKIVPESILASLQIQLDDCNKDVYRWLAMAKPCLPASNMGTKAAFKKFLLALERQRMTDIYVEIAAHKDNIMTKLSVIGRCFDIDQSTTLEVLCKRLKAWDGFEQSIELVNGERKDALVPSYENVSQAGSSSLASIAESLSRIENKMGDFVGPSRSQHGSQPGSIGSFDSASVSRGHRRRWSSEPSQYSASTAPRSHESMSASLSKRITQSLLGVRMEAPPSGYRHPDTNLDEGPNAYDFNEVDQRFPQDARPGIQYGQSTQIFNKLLNQEATKYIDLILQAEAIIYKIKLFRTTPSILFGLSDQMVHSEIDALEARLGTINSEAKALQASSWRKGFNTQDLDSYMARCREPGSDLRAMNHAVPQQEKGQGDTDVSVTDDKLRLKALTRNATRNDCINVWLLKNLEASSKEMKLHRSFLPTAVTLDKEQWTRMVLKYWLLDEAATGPEDECSSSNGAVDSNGICHSERVLLENHI
ncbi:hypothetical protein BDZ45DRAFT_699232 [Acephala macrosclerotiorum]|nr:hypothetical protein BDZ45DRAFT_699232 [Acephala macrosclerotiorum]